MSTEAALGRSFPLGSNSMELPCLPIPARAVV